VKPKAAAAFALLATAILAAIPTAAAWAQDWTAPRDRDAATRAWERPRPEAPAKPAAAKRVYSEAESQRIGAEARRKAEERQAGWDRKMKDVSGSICRGC
jgi:hypothetical protein